MFGLEFLFSAALFALPLAVLPLVLHLLYRRKSPVVHFPTLRFIKASLEQSAARRKVQRWLLLAIRILLLALLIWAVAQPARALATRFFSSGESLAVIVVDTSWSMQYRQDQDTLLNDADRIVQSLLRNELKSTSVLLVTSDGDGHKSFQAAGEMLANWVPLQTAASHDSLADRVVEAQRLLAQQPSGQKLMVIISDFQAREFPRPLPQLADPALRVVAIDLHPDQPRSAGVQKITLNPAQPVAGLHMTADVDVAGPPGEARAVGLTIASLDGKPLLTRQPVMVSFDSFGQGSARFEFPMPQSPWQLITAALAGQDPMSWDDTRTLAVELPGRQSVAVREGTNATDTARRIVQLALDPSEGRLADWPLAVMPTTSSKASDAVVALLDSVPPQSTVDGWRRFANAGGTLILLLKPGIEANWPDTQAARELEQLLPSRPYKATLDEPLKFLPAGAAKDEPAIGHLADDAKLWEGLRASRIVPMTVSDPQAVRMLIATSSADRRPATDRDGLLFIRRMGKGRVFTWATLPDNLSNNLGTHPLFLPLLVNQGLRPANISHADNATTGQPIAFEAGDSPKNLEIHTPAGEVFRVANIFAQTRAPGIYQWFVTGEKELRGLTNVTPPGDESDVAYRAAETVLPKAPNILIARSLPEMQTRISEVTQPQPKWSLPLAIAISLLVAEALISTQTGGWFSKHSS